MLIILFYILDIRLIGGKKCNCRQNRECSEKFAKPSHLIYEYCGTNADIQSINVECTKPNSHEYHFKFLATHSDNATEMEPYIPALKAAYAAIHQGKPFATTLNIQSYLYSFGKRLNFHQLPIAIPFYRAWYRR